MPAFAWSASCPPPPPMDRRPSLCVLPTPPSTASISLGPTALSRWIPLSSPAALSPDDRLSQSVARSTDRPAPPRRRLSECVFDSDEMEQLAARGLVVDDREQMDDFMSFATEAADCGPSASPRSAHERA